ncbi:Lysine-type exporter protein (LYSE/YGGA) [Acididesulfobacillus acetoxydans]|uniref:Lysine exporter protein (LYSE/YGGA) n=1 Tax=Acididesulfobacillus acetoxydans TaxID=1561005 RepID=A0A8S0X6U5_9FIRM|nr:LysE family transporter [Acididesulfobacillus acetoxydans]CAA7602810.1 Lysine-type exporter protein (LYSE/YGGA) [Acididesulfobacillus acetoxydans]CEJ06007.1 Lysine exporter protein (LYSE/YGGA) [Acididesulfobacillus acetoxydans]
MDFLLRGLIIGVSIAAPVGPIGLLCIQRTLMQGRISGFLSGLGAATADAVYGGIVGFGINLVSSFLMDQRIWIHLTGGALLLLLGIKGLFARPAERAAQTKTPVRGLWWSYLSTFVLTLANPMTILSFVAVFAALGVANSSHQYLRATLTVSGVFLGSALWWLILSGVAARLKGKLNRSALVWIGRLSAAIIIGFGIFGIVSSGVVA